MNSYERARLKRIKEANEKWLEKNNEQNQNKKTHRWNLDFLRKRPSHTDGTFLGKVKDES